MSTSNDLLVLGLDKAATQLRINTQLNQILAQIGTSKEIDIKVNLNSDAANSSVRNQVDQIRSQYSQMEKWQDQFYKNNLNGIDMEIRAREDAARRFSALLKSQMQQAQATQKSAILDDTLATNVKKAQQELLNLKSTCNSIGNDPALSKRWQELFDSTAVIKSRDELTNLNAKVGLFKKELGGTNDVMGQSFKRATALAAVLKTIQLAIQVITAAVQKVEALDKSLTEFNKVSDLSVDQLKAVTEQAYEMADELGRAGSEILDATTEFKRSGYEIQESMEMAKSALIMSGVGDGIDNVTDASSALISVLRGFNMEAEDTLAIVDRINNVSNNSPINFEDITEGLTRVSGTMAQTGTSLDETIGLLTGGYAQLQNIEKVSSGLIMISQRLRGVDEDENEIDGLRAKMQDAFGKIGVSIQDANGELRSTFEILKDYASVYNTLTKEQQRYYNELASANRQVPVINAMMQNWRDVEDAIQQSANSAGSATEEYEIWQNSIEGIKSELKGALEELATTAIDSNWVKVPLKLLTELVQILTKIVDNDLIMGAFGIFVGSKLFSGVSKIKGLVSGVKEFASEYKQAVHLITSWGKQAETITNPIEAVVEGFDVVDDAGEPKIVPSYLEAA